MLSALETSQLEVDRAAGEGHVEVLDSLWKTSKGAVHPSPAGLQMAAAAGEIVTLEWAHWREIHGFDGLMDIAAWRGRLSILKWLHSNQQEGCTANAVNWAAQSGHLKVLRWLRGTLGQPCTGEALEAAAIAGHTRVVAWMLRHSQDQTIDTTPAVVAAACNGHVDVLNVLLSAPGEEVQKSGWAVALASDGGHDDCVKLLQDAHWPSGSAVARRAASSRSVPQEGYPLCRGEESEGALPEGSHSAWGERAREESRGEEETREPGENDTVQRAKDKGANITVPARTPADLSLVRPSLSPGKHSRSPTQGLSREVHRVLSLDVALPRTDSAGNMPPTSSELLKCRVCRTPARPPSSASSLDLDGVPVGNGQVISPRIYVGPPNANRAGEGLRQGWDERAPGDEWLAWGAGRNRERRSRGVDDGGGADGGEKDATRTTAFFEATQALAAGAKNRVRDVWTPVPRASPSGLRLNLGVLAMPSRDPVVSAYIEGLLQDRQVSLDACRIHRCTLEKADKSLREAQKSRLRARRTSSPSESSRLLPFHPVIGCKDLTSTPKPSPAATTAIAPPAANGITLTFSCASADAAGATGRPRKSPFLRDWRLQKEKQQLQMRQQRRAVSGRCLRRKAAAAVVTAAGHPVPSTSATIHPTRVATAPALTPALTFVASEAPMRGRAGTAPAHSTSVGRRRVREDQGAQFEDPSCWSRELLDLPGEEFADSADGSIGGGGAGGTGEGFGGNRANCRRRPPHTRQIFHTRPGLSPCHQPASREARDGTSLVCWGRGKRPASPAPASPERTRHRETSPRVGHGTSGTRTPASSPWARGPASYFGVNERVHVHRQEAVPRGMFLTRRHRCGNGMAPPA